jgi:hypothetical protein
MQIIGYLSGVLGTTRKMRCEDIRILQYRHDMRNAHKCLARKSDGKRPTGRPESTWSKAVPLHTMEAQGGVEV